ncbi:hypothetical protein ACFW81_23845 [Streptomyces angustmyceticus]|uniref:hypothetical protein n=1 Tax=Streptomyces angustmyceticus TaxID=285578 RepID=UPI0036C1509F
MTTRRPSKPWRLVIDGSPYPQRSEAATQDAVAEHKATAQANQIIVEKWEAGHWGEWLRWVRDRDGNWTAE